jgi:KUP system potassium uptake protein
MWRVTARYGFMEKPDIPKVLKEVHRLGCTVSLDDVSYYVGHETVFRRAGHVRLPAWQERLYAAMQRNSAHLSEFFHIPHDDVVEIGRQVEI